MENKIFFWSFRLKKFFFCKKKNLNFYFIFFLLLIHKNFARKFMSTSFFRLFNFYTKKINNIFTARQQKKAAFHWQNKVVPMSLSPVDRIDADDSCDGDTEYPARRRSLCCQPKKNWLNRKEERERKKNGGRRVVNLC